MRSEVTTKARLNLKIEADLKEWIQEYVKRHGTSVSQLIREYFRVLRLQEESQDEEHVSQI